MSGAAGFGPCLPRSAASSLDQEWLCLQGQDEREQQVRANLAAEKDQLRKHQDRELRTLREQYENSQVPLDHSSVVFCVGTTLRRLLSTQDV